jgi:hypothetical protein
VAAAITSSSSIEVTAANAGLRLAALVEVGRLTKTAPRSASLRAERRRAREFRDPQEGHELFEKVTTS